MMKKNSDGSFTVNQKDVNLGILRCEVPVYPITRYEFYLLSHNESSGFLKTSDMFLKMFYGFVLQLAVSWFLACFDEDNSGHRMDIFQYVSMGISLLVFGICRLLGKLQGTERSKVLNKISEKLGN